MQSNSDFIPYFSILVAPLRILLNSKERFNWTMFHQNVFHKLLQGFRKEEKQSQLQWFQDPLVELNKIMLN